MIMRRTSRTPRRLLLPATIVLLLAEATSGTTTLQLVRTHVLNATATIDTTNTTNTSSGNSNSDSIFNGWVYDLAFHPSGSQELVAVGYGGALRVWNYPSDSPSETYWRLQTPLLTTHNGTAVTAVAYRPAPQDDEATQQAPQLAATTGEDATVRLWDTSSSSSSSTTWTETAVIVLASSTDNEYSPQPRSLAWHPSGSNVLAVAGAHLGGGAVLVYKSNNNGVWQPRVLPLDDNDNNTGIIHRLDWNPDGTRLVVDHVVYEFDADVDWNDALDEVTWHVVGEILSDTNATASHPQWSPDGKRIAAIVASNDDDDGGVVGIARVEDDSDNDLEFGRSVAMLRPFEEDAPSFYWWILSLRWSPNAKYLLAGGAGQAKGFLWRVAEDADVFSESVELPSSTGGIGVTAVAWSPDGGTVAVVANGGAIDLWRAVETDNGDGGDGDDDTVIQVPIVETDNDNDDDEYEKDEKISMQWAIVIGAVLMVVVPGTVLVTLKLRLRSVRRKVAAGARGRRGNENDDAAEGEEDGNVNASASNASSSGGFGTPPMDEISYKKSFDTEAMPETP